MDPRLMYYYICVVYNAEHVTHAYWILYKVLWGISEFEIESSNLIFPGRAVTYGKDMDERKKWHIQRRMIKIWRHKSKSVAAAADIPVNSKKGHLGICVYSVEKTSSHHAWPLKTMASAIKYPNTSFSPSLFLIYENWNGYEFIGGWYFCGLYIPGQFQDCLIARQLCNITLYLKYVFYY